MPFGTAEDIVYPPHDPGILYVGILIVYYSDGSRGGELLIPSCQSLHCFTSLKTSLHTDGMSERLQSIGGSASWMRVQVVCTNACSLLNVSMFEQGSGPDAKVLLHH
jgi:hypothetical protein